MIQLRFNSLAGTDPAILGPAPSFRLEGPLLQHGGQRCVVGRYYDHHWEIGNRYVSSYECVEVALLHFEAASGEASRTYGPFQQVRFPNGSCYADRALFAELVEEGGAEDAAPASRRGHWLHRADLTRWSTLVISAASAALTPR